LKAITAEKKLRNNPAREECYLWNFLRRKQLGGVKFRRQHRIGEYIVDFAALEEKLVIELDGWHHRKNKFKDMKRDAVLMKNGYKVLLFWNNEVTEKTDAVLNEIRNNF
jgi:very-short-patch-repair endonuclease